VTLQLQTRTDSAEPVATPAPSVPSLEIAGVHLSYGQFAALKGIDLAVGRGEFVALLGPSGCGKTSLLRTIAGFVQAQRGRVLLAGRDVAGLPPRDRNIGIVFQSYALFPHMSVLDNVLFGLQCRKVPKATALARAHQAIGLVGLSSLADRRPKQLSGGQQQRVALARAIVIEPHLLLLDEPLGALDKQLRVQMQTELKTLQRRLGVTAVFVTHDQEEAMSMADRIVVMRNGLIEQVAAPEALFRRPNSAWVCEFVGAGNLLRGDLVPLGGGRLRLEMGPGVAIEVMQQPGDEAGCVVQVPFNKLRLAVCAEGAGLPVIGRRFLGSTVEVQLAHGPTVLSAQMPMDDAAAFPIGTQVRVSAGAADCRLLPDR
jgi:ABC-type Fe3+/spermidine/putrescine transport system ATPase subunit